MTPDSPARRIVVGYDGSPASRAALARAAERAGADGRIYVVHAYSLPDRLARRCPTTRSSLDVALDRARALDRPDRGRVRRRPPGRGLGDRDHRRRPARAIADVATARHADEIIVGTRGFGRARALLGSVAHELIHLADCPITVIPERVVDRAEAARRQERRHELRGQPVPAPRRVTPPPPPDTRWLQTPVRAFMRPGVVTVAEDASLLQVQRAMVAHGVHAVLITAVGGPVGWVTAARAAAVARRRSPRCTPRGRRSPRRSRTSRRAPPPPTRCACSRPDVGHLVVSPRTAASPQGVVSEIDLVRLASGA